MTDQLVCRPRDDEHLFVYSEEDIEAIYGDLFCELREVVGDDQTAAEALDIMRERLTDEFYSHHE